MTHFEQLYESSGSLKKFTFWNYLNLEVLNDNAQWQFVYFISEILHSRFYQIPKNQISVAVTLKLDYPLLC